jgi:hypothetical protein
VRQRGGDRLQVGGVAAARRSLRQLVGDAPLQPAAAPAGLDAGGRQPEAARQLSQQLNEAQVGPWRRFAPVTGDSTTATTPASTAARRTGPSSTKAGFRFAMPLT